MLRASATPHAARRDERAGTVVDMNADGTYVVIIGGARWERVPSADLRFLRPGERVRVVLGPSGVRIEP
jgi:membrane protein implicated in regulation of membrane protease activity